MADQNPNVNAAGFCPQTKIFHSLRPQIPLPPISQPLSISQYVLSLLHSSHPVTNTTVLIDSISGDHLSYPTFLRRIKILAFNLKALTFSSSSSLPNRQVAFILSPSSLHVPVLYFALLSLGLIISPANPISSDSEIQHQIHLSKPVVAFATSETRSKLPSLPLGTILIDSPEFFSMMTEINAGIDVDVEIEIDQSNSAAILYSSGTTGRVKGVELTHRNLIAVIAGFHALTNEGESEELEVIQHVSLFTLPLFHVFGLFMMLRAIARGETMVLMKRFDFEGMLRAVEKFRATYIPVSPPLVVALAKSELVEKYDLSSVRLLGSGGAPLGKEVVEKFRERFPDVEIAQGYGLTESTGAAARTLGPDECKNTRSVGRLAENMEAKIVDPVSGEALGPGKKGELWLRGPAIMKSYVEDHKATAETMDPEGWLKTGDLCYFDSDGFLYIVDRLKELIKYKAYQVPPAELEHLLQSNPEIIDAAVIPYPNEEAGEIPMAYVVRKPGSNINEAQVIDYIANRACFYFSFPQQT